MTDESPKRIKELEDKIFHLEECNISLRIERDRERLIVDTMLHLYDNPKH